MRFRSSWVDTAISLSVLILMGFNIFIKFVPTKILKVISFGMIGIILLIHCHQAKAEDQKIDISDMGWTVSLILGIIFLFLSICSSISYLFR